MLSRPARVGEVQREKARCGLAIAMRTGRPGTSSQPTLHRRQNPGRVHLGPPRPSRLPDRFQHPHHGAHQRSRSRVQIHPALIHAQSKTTESLGTRRASMGRLPGMSRIQPCTTTLDRTRRLQKRSRGTERTRTTSLWSGQLPEPRAQVRFLSGHASRCRFGKRGTPLAPDRRGEA